MNTMSAESLLKYAILELRYIWDDKTIATDLIFEDIKV